MVKKISSERCQSTVSEGCGRSLSPITGPPPHPLIHEEINEQKILELIHKMVELLTGEVPIKCQDVAVYFSMEEWEYVEGHKDLYKDVMMEEHQPLTSPGRSSKRRTPERCPSPLPPQDHQLLNQEEDLNNIKAKETYVSPDNQCKDESPTEAYVTGDDQCKEEHCTETHESSDDQCKEELSTKTYVNSKEELPTEAYMRSDDQCKEEFPTYNHPDDCIGTSVRPLVPSDFKVDDRDITEDTYEESAIISDIPSALHSKDLSSDPFQHLLSSDSSQTVNENYSHKMDVVGQPSDLERHQTSHTREKPYSCPECGKRFDKKTRFVEHQRSHTGEKPYSCTECGKCFAHKSGMIKHQILHSEEKPFSCPECGKCFSFKSSLTGHQRSHTGETFSCPECGKCYKSKSSLSMHQKIHTGDQPFSCSQCGKRYAVKSLLAQHMKSHAEEKPYSCSECGKGFTQKSHLVGHLRIHTGEKPYSCSECGKCFAQKVNVLVHQNTHTGLKPYSCSECGKCFTQKSSFVTHQRLHTLKEKPTIIGGKIMVYPTRKKESKQ
ncbi:zinc finger protein 2-like isoform X2 [Bufo gargarizans]|nr:zinc finger protein 2-like isoform X2 [Bufo gargarizans]